MWIGTFFLIIGVFSAGFFASKKSNTTVTKLEINIISDNNNEQWERYIALVSSWSGTWTISKNLVHHIIPIDKAKSSSKNKKEEKETTSNLHTAPSLVDTKKSSINTIPSSNRYPTYTLTIPQSGPVIKKN